MLYGAKINNTHGNKDCKRHVIKAIEEISYGARVNNIYCNKNCNRCVNDEAIEEMLYGTNVNSIHDDQDWTTSNISVLLLFHEFSFYFINL